MRAPFVQACAPTEDELHSLLHTVITRLMKMLTRRGVLIEERIGISLRQKNLWASFGSGSLPST